MFSNVSMDINDHLSTDLAAFGKFWYHLFIIIQLKMCAAWKKSSASSWDLLYYIFIGTGYG